MTAKKSAFCYIDHKTGDHDHMNAHIRIASCDKPAMTAPVTPERIAEMRRLVEAAREATGILRDHARTGVPLEFRERDPLVLVIHGAFDKLLAALEAKDAEMARLMAENDRLRQDRYDALDAKTTEGMSAAEWQLRTGIAERRVKELTARWDGLKERARDSNLVATVRIMTELEAQR